jgi:nucleoid-associated protein YgaU
MKPRYKIAGAVILPCLMSIADIPGLSVKLVSEAHALRGRGAAFAVGAAAGSAASSSSAAASQQQAATAQQQAAAAQQQAAIEKEKAATAQQQAAASGKSLPLGTVVATLPAGCTPTPVGEVNYYYCGGNFYQAVYEGSTLKYITTKPK